MCKLVQSPDSLYPTHPATLTLTLTLTLSYIRAHTCTSEYSYLHFSLFQRLFYFRYYLNGGDAFRLRLRLRQEGVEETDGDGAATEVTAIRHMIQAEKGPQEAEVEVDNAVDQGSGET